MSEAENGANYVLRITRRIENPNYDEEAAKRGWSGQNAVRYEDQEALTVELTPDEFQAVKKGVLEAM